MSRLPHGGRLNAAARDHGIPLADWLDLSCALNPWPWPVPNVPTDVWHRLPEDDDGLITAARDYYGSDLLLPIAGSQTAIAVLPRLVSGARRVHVPLIGYAEHAHHWALSGHRLLPWSRLPTPEVVQSGDIVVVINPNNPTGACHSPAKLRQLAGALAARDGLLIVDEAFIDTTPHMSVLNDDPHEGLIVMRSLGKFFGLAGVRLGMVWGPRHWLTRIDNTLEPWHVSHPARWVGQHALADRDWQTRMRQRLAAWGSAWAEALGHTLDTSVASTALFATLSLGKDAWELHHRLAQQGILTRLFAETGLLRLGLPATEQQRDRVLNALRSVRGEKQRV